MPETHAGAAAHAAPRRRVLDEHMFQLNHPGSKRRATFRLQLFEADGHRPVAIATQQMGEGASLTNAAEGCVTAVWETYYPNDPQPPIWIQRLLTNDGDDFFCLVAFALDKEHLQVQRWHPLDDADVDSLVGQQVDRDRGAGFEPWPEEPPDHCRYVAAWVALFPRPRPFREPCMATGTPWWLRIARQFAPRRSSKDCCWYHGGDWHRVSALAIRLARGARTAGVEHDDIPSYALRRGAVLELSEWEREALHSLFEDTVRPYGHLRDRRLRYNNGQHRAQAMIDAGVRRTLVERC